MIYVPTKRGAKEPQNPQSHRVGLQVSQSKLTEFAFEVDAHIGFSQRKLFEKSGKTYGKKTRTRDTVEIRGFFSKRSFWADGDSVTLTFLEPI